MDGASPGSGRKPAIVFRKTGFSTKFDALMAREQGCYFVGMAREHGCYSADRTRTWVLTIPMAREHGSYSDSVRFHWKISKNVPNQEVRRVWVRLAVPDASNFWVRPVRWRQNMGLISLKWPLATPPGPPNRPHPRCFPAYPVCPSNPNRT